MILIHQGTLECAPTPGTEIIRQVEDYVSARLAIRDARRSGVDLDVYILTRVCDDWFWDLTGFSDVCFMQEDPVAKLCAKLGVQTLPPEIADPAIVTTLQLLNLPDPAQPVSDVSAWVLGHQLDQVWTTEHLTYAHLTALIAWRGTHSVPEILQPLASRRLGIWTDLASGQIREAYRGIQEDFEKSSVFLCCWQALRVYNEQTRARWLEQAGWYLPNLQWIAEKLGDLPMPPMAEKALSRIAEAFWRRRLSELEES